MWDPKQATATIVTRNEYARDPSRVFEQARTHGPVTITDAHGKPRMMIIIPKHVRAELER